MTTLKKLFLITGFITLLVSVSSAFAGTNTRRVDRRQVKQQNRIEQGIRSGSLTQNEVRKLEEQQQRIRQAEDKAKADGVVTRRERLRLNRQQNKASRNIYRKKHNLRRR